MGDMNNNVGFPDTEPLVCDYPGSLAVPPLELMFLSDGSISSVAAGKCAPVTSLTDTGSKATNQQKLSGAFLGLAGSRKATTDGSGTMAIHRQAIRQMTCNTLLSAAKVGDMVAGSVLTATGGTALTSFIVEVTTDASKKIGYVIQAAAAGSTTLKVYFQSNVVPETLGGSQAINTAANLTLAGNLSVGGNSAIIRQNTGLINGSVDQAALLIWNLVAAYIEETENRIIDAEFAKTEAERKIESCLSG